MNVAQAVKISLEQAPEILPNVPTLEQIRALERAIPDADLDLYDVESLTEHHFCEGMYARELNVPKGCVIVGKMHAEPNFFLLAKGDMTVWTPNGMKRVKAPFMVVTQPGDKRVGYAHEDSITYNFHPNPDNERDMVILEARYIVDETKQIVNEKRDLIEVQS